VREAALQRRRRDDPVRRRRGEAQPGQEALHPAGAGQGRGVQLGGTDLLGAGDRGHEERVPETASACLGDDVHRLDVHAYDVRERPRPDDAGEQQPARVAVERGHQDETAGERSERSQLVAETVGVVRAQLRPDGRLAARQQAHLDEVFEIVRARDADVDTWAHGGRASRRDEGDPFGLVPSCPRRHRDRSWRSGRPPA